MAPLELLHCLHSSTGRPAPLPSPIRQLSTGNSGFDNAMDASDDLVRQSYHSKADTYFFFSGAQHKRAGALRHVLHSGKGSISGRSRKLAKKQACQRWHTWQVLLASKDSWAVSLQGCRIGHLDRPYKDWPLSVGATPAAAMRLPEHGRIRVGGPANFILFRARCFSELLSRPQVDRVRTCLIFFLMPTPTHSSISRPLHQCTQCVL